MHKSAEIHFAYTILSTILTIVLIFMYPLGRIAYALDNTTMVNKNQLITTDVLPTSISENDFLYIKNNENDGITIFKYIGQEKNIILPSKIDGYTVTSIADDAFIYESLTQIYVSEGISTIGNNAFACCSSLECVILPSSLRNIGESAFAECTALKSINIPEGISTISYQTFSGCCSLKEVVLPDSLLSIGEDAFRCCESLTNVIIPNCVTHIDKDAFASCSALTEVTLPDSITSIASSSFDNKVERITCYRNSHSDVYFRNMFPNVTITYIGESSNCYSEYGYYAEKSGMVFTGFYAPQMGDSFQVPGQINGTNVSRIGSGAFYNFSYSQIVLPHSVISIDEDIFFPSTENEALETIYIPDSVVDIDKDAFSPFFCTKLVEKVICARNSHADYYFQCMFPNVELDYLGESKNLYPEFGYLLVEDGIMITATYVRSDKCIIPDHIAGISVVEIGPHAFAEGSSSMIVYSSIEIPDTVKRIDHFAFCECMWLSDIVIPNSVESIGDSAFYNCFSLTSISIPDSVKHIGTKAFSECSSLRDVVLSKSLNYIPRFLFSACSSITEVSIPTSIKYIGMGAFDFCSSLSTIEIPNSVISIERYAFTSCPTLMEVYIPSSNKYIADDAFDKHTSLILYNKTPPASVVLETMISLPPAYSAQ